MKMLNVVIEMLDYIIQSGDKGLYIRQSMYDCVRSYLCIDTPEHR